MIAYLDSSVLARAYLADEDGHGQATALLADPDIATVTGTWTRIEVSGALVRAARAGRADEKGLLAALDADLAGPVLVLDAPQELVENDALKLVRRHALRAMDAWHLAVAALVIPPLLAPGEQRGFASRDAAQRRVAEKLGFLAL
ncbi:type II toxin-antitoxin system VapC family toxin [[Mycobacterium] kokjensenii]|uniref:Ribonuclease VapC n=1 Tax=[Mycobacterium] kokjensenii TaxID=3064287 RepID=A0ABM9L7C7_9MYCO|nr:type II toxin-antitoxin system VapC family toxin [Mycolicibacter sp. MU0083]CAJ1493950.1 type II toxin-antitoxin system VapC family toxin [Mycolicibacter sp. MU0083]